MTRHNKDDEVEGHMLISQPSPQKIQLLMNFWSSPEKISRSKRIFFFSPGWQSRITT